MKKAVQILICIGLFIKGLTADAQGPGAWASSLDQRTSWALGLTFKAYIHTTSWSCTERSDFSLGGGRKFHSCSQAAKNMYRALDCNFPRITCFDEDSQELMNSPQTNAYLTSLNEVLKNPPINFNLWIWTLAHPAIKNSPNEALRYLAVLFQDNTVGFGPSTLDKGSPNGRLHDEVLQRLTSVLKRIELYPPGISAKENIGLYHFYVVSYLSYRMARAGYQKHEELPYLLNARYEELASNQGSLTDIYLGYAGVAFASALRVGKSSEFIKLVSLSSFKKIYALGGSQAVVARWFRP